MGVRRKTWVAGLAIVAIVMPGCGVGGGGKSEMQKARDAITELVTALNHHDYRTVCSLLSDQVVAQIQHPGMSCKKVVSRAAPKGAAELTLRIDQVRVRGDNATVDATVSRSGGVGRTETILMVKQDGSWKFAQTQF